jgi:hypothetical protein
MPELSSKFGKEATAEAAEKATNRSRKGSPVAAGKVASMTPYSDG